MAGIINKNKWYLYILECADNSFYTGITDDLNRRLNEHNSKKASKYTRTRTPVKLLYQESCRSKSEALKRELQIKGWNRKKKSALINNQINLIPPAL